MFSDRKSHIWVLELDPHQNLGLILKTLNKNAWHGFNLTVLRGGFGPDPILSSDLHLNQFLQMKLTDIYILSFFFKGSLLVIYLAA